METTHTRDEDDYRSAAFIVAGKLFELKALRQVILDFLEAFLDASGAVHQKNMSREVRLVYHSIGAPKWVIDHAEYDRIKVGEKQRAKI